MVIRMLKQVKVFDIIAYGEVLSGQGFCYELEGICWVKNQIWESDEHCNNLLYNAIKEWEVRKSDNPWGVTSNKPKLIIYWQTIEQEHNN